jgi:hypothetical protein
MQLYPLKVWFFHASRLPIRIETQPHSEWESEGNRFQTTYENWTPHSPFWPKSVASRYLWGIETYLYFRIKELLVAASRLTIGIETGGWMDGTIVQGSRLPLRMETRKFCGWIVAGAHSFRYMRNETVRTHCCRQLWAFQTTRRNWKHTACSTALRVGCASDTMRNELEWVLTARKPEGTLPTTYEELKHFPGSRRSSWASDYLWGIEPKLRKCELNDQRSRLPMRNWNLLSFPDVAQACCGFQVPRGIETRRLTRY